MAQSLVLTSTGVENAQYRELLLSSIQSLWTAKKMLDITFLVDGQEIWAHQLVLASASSDLCDALIQIQKTTKNAVLDLNRAGITVSGLQELLNYLYFGKMKLTPDLCEEVAKAAKTLHIPQIVALCELFKATFMPATNPATSLPTVGYAGNKLVKNFASMSSSSMKTSVDGSELVDMPLPKSEAQKSSLEKTNLAERELYKELSDHKRSWLTHTTQTARADNYEGTVVSGNRAAQDVSLPRDKPDLYEGVTKATKTDHEMVKHSGAMLREEVSTPKHNSDCLSKSESSPVQGDSVITGKDNLPREVKTEAEEVGRDPSYENSSQEIEPLTEVKVELMEEECEDTSQTEGEKKGSNSRGDLVTKSTTLLKALLSADEIKQEPLDSEHFDSELKDLHCSEQEQRKPSKITQNICNEPSAKKQKVDIADTGENTPATNEEETGNSAVSPVLNNEKSSNPTNQAGTVLCYGAKKHRTVYVKPGTIKKPQQLKNTKKEKSVRIVHVPLPTGVTLVKPFAVASTNGLPKQDKQVLFSPPQFPSSSTSNTKSKFVSNSSTLDMSSSEEPSSPPANSNPIITEVKSLRTDMEREIVEEVQTVVPANLVRSSCPEDKPDGLSLEHAFVRARGIKDFRSGCNKPVSWTEIDAPDSKYKDHSHPSGKCSELAEEGEDKAVIHPPSVTMKTGKGRFHISCILCHFLFSSVESCEKHILRKHFPGELVFADGVHEKQDKNDKGPRNKELLYLCSCCGFVTHNERFIYLHRFYQHEVPIVRSMIRPYCNSCELLLHKDTDMEAHRKLHRNHYICNTCYKRYLCLDRLCQHVRNAHGVQGNTELFIRQVTYSSDS